jgi:hypothetical protein
MHSDPSDPVVEGVPAACPGLLSPALRRDLTDLNAQYLELGALAAPLGDLRFGWSEPVHRRLADLEAQTRRRMADVPFAIFKLRVPPATPDPVAGIADAARGMPAADWNARCASFAHQAAFFARRLCDGAPLAANVVLDLRPEAQSLLASLRPSQLAEFAAHPGFVRPRWPHHQRYWQMLEAAASRESTLATQWAHCVGVCLLGVDDDDSAAAAPPVARRRPRR